MSGVSAAMSTVSTGVFQYYFDCSINSLDTTSVTLRIGTYNSNMISSLRGYIMIWDERTYEDSGMMIATDCTVE